MPSKTLPSLSGPPMHVVTMSLLWVCAIGCGLVAGIYFAFSTFIMQALARVETDAGIAAMQSINRAILRSPFMPLFFVTTLAAASLALLAVLQWSAAGSLAMF